MQYLSDLLTYVPMICINMAVIATLLSPNIRQTLLGTVLFIESQKLHIQLIHVLYIWIKNQSELSNRLKYMAPSAPGNSSKKYDGDSTKGSSVVNWHSLSESSFPAYSPLFHSLFVCLSVYLFLLLPRTHCFLWRLFLLVCCTHTCAAIYFHFNSLEKQFMR